VLRAVKRLCLQCLKGLSSQANTDRLRLAMSSMMCDTDLYGLWAGFGFCQNKKGSSCVLIFAREHELDYYVERNHHDRSNRAKTGNRNAILQPCQWSRYELT
jgi:hypothetical protein